MDMVRTARLKAYWAHGEGLAKWIDTPHPYTTLMTLLAQYVNAHVAHGEAANIFHEATGMWPGERKGKNPLGPG